MTDAVVGDPRWGFGERGWTVDERDAFVRQARAAGASWAHHDGRMQGVLLHSAHITFGDRPEDKSRVWLIRFNAAGELIEGPRWLDGGPAEWRRAVGLPDED